MKRCFNRCCVGSAVLLAISMVASRSHAQPLGQAGDVSFAADRLMGLYIHDPDRGSAYTLLGLGLSPSVSLYQVARLGIDGFVTNHLSIGGSLAFWTRDRRGPGGAVSGGLIAPRVGYAFDFSRAFGFWPRGGFTYSNDNGQSDVALTVEGMFFASPASHFAFTFGPALDFTIAGDRPRSNNFGLLTFGVLGWI